ncbi:hypothetical protein PFMALIP_05766 [Plasmodium falciparum MaliPS096_E11]|uniref:Uncharacterized protein n=1 Tax=Plasmodium falciparum MaliPS096_E11 TaxID=1036727 RepID=A0A024WG50_PLAFA|nr:hypothetical protein PFMALIP_05766 [Plasmodium falciparum MaliPS096_E11]
MLTHESMSSALKSLTIASCSTDLAGATGTAYAIFVPCEEEKDHGNMNARNIYVSNVFLKI